MQDLYSRRNTSRLHASVRSSVAWCGRCGEAERLRHTVASPIEAEAHRRPTYYPATLADDTSSARVGNQVAGEFSASRPHLVRRPTSGARSVLYAPWQPARRAVDCSSAGDVEQADGRSGRCRRTSTGPIVGDDDCDEGERTMQCEVKSSLRVGRYISGDVVACY